MIFGIFQDAQNMVIWPTTPKVVNFATKKKISRRKRGIFQKKKIAKFVKAIWRVHQQLLLENIWKNVPTTDHILFSLERTKLEMTKNQK